MQKALADNASMAAEQTHPHQKALGYSNSRYLLNLCDSVHQISVLVCTCVYCCYKHRPMKHCNQMRLCPSSDDNIEQLDVNRVSCLSTACTFAKDGCLVSSGNEENTMHLSTPDCTSLANDPITPVARQFVQCLTCPDTVTLDSDEPLHTGL